MRLPLEAGQMEAGQQRSLRRGLGDERTPDDAPRSSGLALEDEEVVADVVEGLAVHVVVDDVAIAGDGGVAKDVNRHVGHGEAVDGRLAGEVAIALDERPRADLAPGEAWKDVDHARVEGARGIGRTSLGPGVVDGADDLADLVLGLLALPLLLLLAGHAGSPRTLPTL